MLIDRDAPLQFLRTAFQPDDWVAVLLKWRNRARAAQRVAPVSVLTAPHIQEWLQRENLAADVYVSVNCIAPGKASRKRSAIHTIRHLFLDADVDGAEFLTALAGRRDLPPPSYVLHSSARRVHVFWRVAGFTREHVEAVQKQLVRELGADPAATACSQTTRLPGFRSHKYDPPVLVTVDYRDIQRVYTRDDFPVPVISDRPRVAAGEPLRCSAAPILDRARRYLTALPPAIAGQHGDIWTFRVCCRLVRGFALSDAEAMSLLAEWNTRCEPPWSERDLREKLRRARRYGREPIGTLIGAASTMSASADRRHQ